MDLSPEAVAVARPSGSSCDGLRYIVGGCGGLLLSRGIVGGCGGSSISSGPTSPLLFDAEKTYNPRLVGYRLRQEPGASVALLSAAVLLPRWRRGTGASCNGGGRPWILQHIVILCYRAKTIVLVTLQRCVARLPLREVTCLLPNFVLRPPPAPRNDAPVGAVLSGVVPPARTRPASRVIAFHFLTRARVQLDFCIW